MKKLILSIVIIILHSGCVPPEDTESSSSGMSETELMGRNGECDLFLSF